MEIGKDPYAIFVGGEGPNSDLYAVRPEGGPPVRITFTNVAELAPALSPDGGGLAFLRGTSLTDSTPASIWVMNLLSGGERELVLPKGESPIDVGWAPDGKSLIVSASKGLYRFNVPPADPGPRPIPAAERERAESSLAVLLGDPVFTRVVPCKTPRDLCVVGANGKSRLLAQAVRDPARWGGDSVAFFVGDWLQIRPLGPGRPRILMMTKAPERPRGMTFFSGTREQ
jgi:dipeptidyl aminopeptidase/acylaminoacyl peptidase